MNDLDELCYPVGKFNASQPGSRAEQIETLRSLPGRLCHAVSDLSDSQLDTPYRDGGWTVRQVVHHIADSHTNGYLRFKLALTEDNPTVKLYDQAAWAALADSCMPVEVSIEMTAAVHARLVALIESFSGTDFERTFQHPERGPMTLGTNLALYAWHARHHLAHITTLRGRMGW